MYDIFVISMFGDMLQKFALVIILYDSMLMMMMIEPDIFDMLRKIFGHMYIISIDCIIRIYL